jgi:hypothetical protein
MRLTNPIQRGVSENRKNLARLINLDVRYDEDGSERNSRFLLQKRHAGNIRL